MECERCGVIISKTFREPAGSSSFDADELETHWVVLIWASLLVPGLGAWTIILVSSIMYYIWRKPLPNKAKKINRHGWAAWFVGNATGVIIIALMSC